MSRKIVAIGLMLASAFIWGVPTAIYSALVVDQFREGNGSVFLILIGPAVFGVGLLLSLALPIWFLRRQQSSEAIVWSATSLGAGILIAGWGILMLGST
jgi:hypothetical protein